MEPTSEKIIIMQGRSQYEANQGTRLGKILLNKVFFFISSDW